MPLVSRRDLIRAAGYGAAALALPEWARAAAPARPNVIVVLADDLGWGQFGPNLDQFALADINPEAVGKVAGRYTPEAAAGNAKAAVPNLTAMAAEGVRMTDAYVPCALCAASRCALMTSRYPQRMGIYTNIDLEQGGIPRDQLFLAQRLQQSGYATAHIGKWHIARGQGGMDPGSGEHPLDRGFDYTFGFNFHSCDYYDSKILFRNREPAQAEGYLTDQFTDEASGFIRRSQGKPFFLYLAYNAVHGPLGRPAPDKYLSRFKSAAPWMNNYYAYLNALDEGVGRVRQTLAELGQEKNTLIFFYSDNGASGGSPLPANGPFLGWKGQVWQGGMRVPMLAWGAGVAQGGRLCREMVSSMDLMPTALEAAGVRLPDGYTVDGRSLLPLLAGRQNGPVHPTLFWAGHLARKWSGAGQIADELTAPPAWAARKGTWMLHYWSGTQSLELYDLAKDQGERTDVAAAHPDVVRDLKAEYAGWFPQIRKPNAWPEERWKVLAP